MAVHRKSFDQPDDVEDFDGDGVMQTVMIGEAGAARSILHPGWSWDRNAKPYTGTDFCPMFHQEYVVAGRILATEGTTRTADVTGLLARRPDLARALLAGTAALLGFPPFVLFFTEVAIVVAGWQAGLGWAMGIVLFLLLVVFAGLARHVSAMTLGPPVAAEPAIATEHRRAPVLIALGAAAILGLMASPLAAQLREAAAVLAAAR